MVRLQAKLLLLLLMMLPVGAAFAQDDWTEELDYHRSLWQSHGIEDYSYILDKCGSGLCTWNYRVNCLRVA